MRTRAPSIVDYKRIVYNRDRPWPTPPRCTARSIWTLPASTSGVSSCRGRRTRAAGRTSSSRSSRSSGGDGPTAVIFGGVHGDEPEGQVAALNLARETRPEDVHGRLIIVPCASPDASRAYTRLWPSGANLNRSFPGDPGRAARRAARRLLLAVPLPAGGHRRRHAQRGQFVDLPAVVGDALGRRSRAAPADDRRHARLEHRRPLRLHRHRRKRAARRRGREAGQDRRLDRARRRRPGHRAHPPGRGERARERAPPFRRARGQGRDAREPRPRAGGDRARDRRGELPSGARVRSLGDPRRDRRSRRAGAAPRPDPLHRAARPRARAGAREERRLSSARSAGSRPPTRATRSPSSGARSTCRSSHEPFSRGRAGRHHAAARAAARLLGGAQGARAGRAGADDRAGARVLRRRADGGDRRHRPRLRRGRPRRDGSRAGDPLDRDPGERGLRPRLSQPQRAEPLARLDGRRPA